MLTLLGLLNIPLDGDLYVFEGRLISAVFLPERFIIERQSFYDLCLLDAHAVERILWTALSTYLGKLVAVKRLCRLILIFASFDHFNVECYKVLVRW